LKSITNEFQPTYLPLYFECQIHEHGYIFEGNDVVPVRINAKLTNKLFDERAVYEMRDLFGQLDDKYSATTPVSQNEQEAILSFYRRWGMLLSSSRFFHPWTHLKKEEPFYTPAEIAEKQAYQGNRAPEIIRELKKTWNTDNLIWKELKIVMAQHGGRLVPHAKPQTLLEALAIAQFYEDPDKYPICKYRKLRGRPRQRLKGSCPPNCRSWVGHKWGPYCQQAYDTEERRKKTE
jgi:hypothetical protein